MMSVEVASGYVIGILVMLIVILYMGLRQDGPWSRRQAKVPVRTNNKDRRPLPPEDLSVAEQIDRFFLVLLAVLGLVVLVRYLTF